MASSFPRSAATSVELDLMKRAVPEAEAGPGADAFDRTPGNVVVDGGASARDASSSSTSSPHDALDKERPETPPEQQRSKAKTAIIMTALGVRCS